MKDYFDRINKPIIMDEVDDLTEEQAEELRKPNNKPIYRGIDMGSGKDQTVIGDHGKITEGIFVEDIWKGERPHNAFTFEGERIRVIMPCQNGDYTVSFDNQPWIIMDKWAICQEVRND